MSIIGQILVHAKQERLLGYADIVSLFVFEFKFFLTVMLAQSLTQIELLVYGLFLLKKRLVVSKTSASCLLD